VYPFFPELGGQTIFVGGDALALNFLTRCVFPENVKTGMTCFSLMNQVSGLRCQCQETLAPQTGKT